MRQSVGIEPSPIADAIGERPGQHFSHIPTVNMMNGTTDTFKILWKVATQNQCISNNTNSQIDTGFPPWSNYSDGYA